MSLDRRRVRVNLRERSEAEGTTATTETAALLSARQPIAIECSRIARFSYLHLYSESKRSLV